MKFSHIAIATVVAAGTMSVAQAAPSGGNEGWYAGAGIGVPRWGSTVDGVDSNGRGAAGKIYGGYGFSPNFALEAGAMSLGESRDATGKVKADGLFVDAVGKWPVVQDWSVLGRIGAAHAKFKGPTGDSSDSGLKLGVGAQYDLSSAVALRAEYEHYHFGSAFDSTANVGTVTASVQVHF